MLGRDRFAERVPSLKREWQQLRKDRDNVLGRRLQITRDLQRWNAAWIAVDRRRKRQPAEADRMFRVFTHIERQRAALRDEATRLNGRVMVLGALIGNAERHLRWMLARIPAARTTRTK